MLYYDRLFESVGPGVRLTLRMEWRKQILPKEKMLCHVGKSSFVCFISAAVQECHRWSYRDVQPLFLSQTSSFKWMRLFLWKTVKITTLSLTAPGLRVSLFLKQLHARICFLQMVLNNYTVLTVSTTSDMLLYTAKGCVLICVLYVYL